VTTGISQDLVYACELLVVGCFCLHAACRHSGRALVFVNAVTALRRVVALLRLLGLPATALHAQQQQRQRLKVKRTAWLCSSVQVHNESEQIRIAAPVAELQFDNAY
jgi:hypothetical protein